MKLAVISFTRNGSRLGGSLVRRFRELGETCDGYVQNRFLNEVQEIPGICCVKEPVAEWTGRRFSQVDGLIFIGAAGIAVRAVAPWLKDKMTDPAVVVVDEAGKYAVSLLSGHVGGANRLARMTADILGAEAVITTASDVQNKTAVDVWAVCHNLKISDRNLAKKAAAAVLEGEPVGFYSDYPLEEPVPEGYARGEFSRINIWITAKKKPDENSMVSWFQDESGEAGENGETGEMGETGGILRLIPRVMTVGIGCRRGISKEQMERTLLSVLDQNNIDPAAVMRFASIDRKRDEQGICQLAEQWNVPFVTYTAEELEQAEGSLAESEFVRKTVGTGNVCERAALLGAGAGSRLVAAKYAENGVTIAVAAADIRIRERKL